MGHITIINLFDFILQLNLQSGLVSADLLSVIVCVSSGGQNKIIPSPFYFPSIIIP
jgi:hypothetical protein